GDESLPALSFWTVPVAVHGCAVRWLATHRGGATRNVACRLPPNRPGEASLAEPRRKQACALRLADTPAPPSLWNAEPQEGYLGGDPDEARNHHRRRWCGDPPRRNIPEGVHA